MRPFAQNARLLLPLLVLAVCQPRTNSQTQRSDGPRPQTEIPALIDRLRGLTSEDLASVPALGMSAFVPLGMMDFGLSSYDFKPLPSSGPLNELIRRGAAAVPHLVAHLDDKRPTKITYRHDFSMGSMFFDDEYDYNRRTAASPPKGVNRSLGAAPDKFHGSHVVTVGDLCFVALGQIVNRDFNAVRSQPTMCIVVNSPTSSAVLRDVIRKEWAGLTPARHRELLVRDFLQPDSEYRRVGACLRLGYYYPEVLEPLVLKQLAEPRYDVFEVEALCRKKLYGTQDAAERKQLFDGFVRQRGEVARQGILRQLFNGLGHGDAELPERSPTDRKQEAAAHACLMELYGYARGLKREDEPIMVPTEDAIQARFIDSLAFYKTANIDRAVRQILHSTDSDYLATACVRYLSGRGADADINRYVAERLRGAGEGRRKDLEALQQRLGWTELHVAVEIGELGLMDRLIRGGADVNARAADGRTPLHVATERDCCGAARLLLMGKADPNLKDRQGLTPVQRAVRARHESTAKLLLAAGADVPDLLVAAFAGRPDLAKSFLQKDRSAAGATTEDGYTPLHLAAQQGHAKVALALLAGGAEVNARDRGQDTPLHWAAACKQRELVGLLLAHNADRKALNKNGESPLDYARYGRDPATIQRLEKVR
jgi:hypothetical protein